jgi:hypothetical protein
MAAMFEGFGEGEVVAVWIDNHDGFDFGAR